MITLKGGNGLNSVMLVGRLAQDIEVKQLESGKEVTNIVLAVNRGYKNADGLYETDFFNCTLWDGLAKNTFEYCHKGDTIAVRGRLQTSSYEKDDVKHKFVDVIVEKITFLSSKKPETKEAE